MKWNTIHSAADLEAAKQASHQQPVLIFKHSTRCSISAAALSRLERHWDDDRAKGLVPYFLDLIAYRPISNQIAQDFGVWHESPQVLLIYRGECIYNASHFDIAFDDIIEHLPKISA
ncbi:bacillithiol system redox-active protein YtxJ [Rhodoflexus caldus]|uniref:bacillithiol system redox-active protein YtxJ n=1 Tax=Rhodoflexus caldus TaxID=2891236 RepID=UPI00202A3390|nr:bacillithiol system redox-active protein YtxJ [Rhodoflexus caldus]